MVSQDVAGKCPLKVAIVPFHEVGVYFRYRSKAGQLARPVDALQGTGENARKENLRSCSPSCALHLATFIQRQVGPARVPVRIGPSRTAVPGEIEVWQL